jgi:hypothetical protein
VESYANSKFINKIVPSEEKRVLSRKELSTYSESKDLPESADDSDFSMAKFNYNNPILIAKKNIRL